MECVSEKQGDVTIVKVNGRLDMSTSGDLDRECSRLIDQGEVRLFFDFEGLQFISSAGLRVILTTAKKVKPSAGSVAFYNLNGIVQEVFKISGFATILPIYDSLEDALAASS